MTLATDRPLDLSSYAEWTLTTAKYLQCTYVPQINYPTDGLIGETREFVEKCTNGSNLNEVAKEAGDVLYYVARVCEDSGININECFLPHDSVNPDSNSLGLCMSAMALKEITKKIARDYNGLVTEAKRQSLKEALSTFCSNFQSYVAYKLPKITLLDIAEQNQEKLMKRLEENKISGDGDNR